LKAGRSVFISSAIFGIVIALVYWVSSHHPAGTLLLAFMATAMIFAAGFMFVVEREARLVGDRKKANPIDGAGEDLGIFTVATIWPLLAALAVLCMLAGAIWSPVAGAAGFIGLLLVLWRLGAESNRI